MTDTPYWTVRKTRYGRLAFDVIGVVGVTTKTHQIREQDHRGTWSRPIRVMGLPSYFGQFDSYTDACQAAQRGNAAWAQRQPGVDAAKAAASAAVQAQRLAAVAAMGVTDAGA